MIHLDANYLILALKPGTRERDSVERWISNGEPLGVSVTAWAEFLCGPLPSGMAARAAQFVGEPLSLMPADAVRGAELYNHGGRRARSLPDCLIAAACIRAGAELATGSVADFSRFVPFGLRIADR